MSYKKQKEQAEKQVKYIILCFVLIAVTKLCANAYVKKQYKNCYYYAYQSAAHGQRCLTNLGWVKVTDLDKKRKRLFEKAQAGDPSALRKLNKLNYEEQLRKQKLRK